MKKNFLSLIALAVAWGTNAQTVEIISGGQVVAFFDSSQYSQVVIREEVNTDASGTASVLSTSGRRNCAYVQLWAGGPKWAAFNVGATITDYANLTIGRDSTSSEDCSNLAPYYNNTANVGGLYAWNNPNINGRQAAWGSSVSTSISDVATTLWGSNWVTPTRQQLDTLRNSSYGKTTWTWCDGSTTQYVTGCTLAGYKVSGVGEYADKCIFLPLAGSFDFFDGTVTSAGNTGCYWSCTPNASYGGADFLYSDEDFASMDDNDLQRGYSIRAVLAE